MKLIFIYGPPAAGKLTIAKELAKLSGWPVFQNHKTHKLWDDIFPYGVPEYRPIRRELSRGLRPKLFGLAAREGRDLITTFGQSGADYYDFFRDIVSKVEGHGGEVVFVQVLASREKLMERITSESRRGQKMDSADVLGKLLDEQPDVLSKFPDIEHTTIDNSELEPAEVAQMIWDEIQN